MNQQDKIIKTKVGLLRLAQELGNVSKAWKVMGYSRDSFYNRFKKLYETGCRICSTGDQQKKAYSQE